MNRKIVLLLAALLLPAFAAAQQDACQQTQCTGVLCQVAGLPYAIQCALTRGLSQMILDLLSRILHKTGQLVAASPPLENQATHAIYDDIAVAAESLFFIVLLLNAVKLVYASAFSAEERMAAKEGLKKTIVNMLLLALAFNLYVIAVDATNAFASAIVPSTAQWALEIQPGPDNNLAFLTLLLLAFVLFAVGEVMRYVLTYLGLFMLVLALVLENTPLAEGFGKFLKLFVAANFVVQIVQAVFLRVAVGAPGDLLGGGIVATATGKVAFAGVTLLAGALAGFAIYMAALGQSIVSSPTGRMFAYRYAFSGGDKDGK